MILQCWQDVRSRTKSKTSKAKSYANKTGCGPPMPKEDTLTTIEEDIGSIIKLVSIEAHDIQESIGDFNFDVNSILSMQHDQKDSFTIDIPENSESLIQEVIPENIRPLECNNKNSDFKENHKVIKTTVQKAKKRIKKKKENYLNVSLAALSYQKYLDKKTETKQKYYEKKT